MQKVWKMTLMEARLFLREPAAAFFTLAFPLVMLFVFGSIFGNDPTDMFGGRGYLDVSVPAYMAMIIGSVGLMSIAINMATYRESGILRRYRTTPVRPHVLLLASVAVNFVMTLLGTLILILVARWVYQLQFAGNAFIFLAAFTLASLSFFAIGFLIAGLASTARVAQVVGMVMFYPMLFLSGAALPREIMPESVRSIAQLLPLTYAVDLLKDAWFGVSVRDMLTEILVLLIILMICSLLAAITFRWE